MKTPTVAAPQLGEGKFGDYINRELYALATFAEAIGAQPPDMGALQKLGKLPPYVPKSPEEAIRRFITRIHEALTRFAASEPALAGIESITPEWNRLRFENRVGDTQCVVNIYLAAVAPGAKRRPFNDEGQPINWAHLLAEGDVHIALHRNGQPYREAELSAVELPALRKLIEELNALQAAQ